MEITLYDDWMEPQIAELFSKQYLISTDEYQKILRNFYNHPYQKEHCIKMVALDNKKVVGFLSFFKWPYVYKGKTFNSYQAGNGLVHDDYRNKGVFQQLFNFLDLHREKLKIDFLIGFPIEASRGSLIRNKWLNIINLKWYLKVIHPFSFLFPLNLNKLSSSFDVFNNHEVAKCSMQLIKLDTAADFRNWRSMLYDNNSYYSFYYKENHIELTFKLKLNIRKKVIRELIIGELSMNEYNQTVIKNGLKELLKHIKQIKCVTIVSIAINELSEFNLTHSLTNVGFKKINKQIYFCVKNFTDEPSIVDANKWMVFRGDIDTW